MKISRYLNLALLLLSAATPAAAREVGPGDAGGGNAQEAEFYLLAQTFYEIVRDNREAVDPAFPLDRLVPVLKALVVKSVPGPLTLDGERKDAVSYPRRRHTDLDTDTWDKRSDERKYALVIHELHVLLQIPDVQYAASNDLARKTQPFLGTALNRIAQKEERFTGFVERKAVHGLFKEFQAGCGSKKELAAIVEEAKKVAMDRCQSKGAQLCHVLSARLLRNTTSSRDPESRREGLYGCYAKAIASGYLEKAEFRMFFCDNGSGVAPTESKARDQAYEACRSSGGSEVKCESLRANTLCNDTEWR